MNQIASPEEMAARRRAALIVQVQSGVIKATEAANQLGVSRKTYYQWEKRALQALVASQREKPGGRPATPHNSVEEALQQQTVELQDQVKLLEQTLAIREQIAELTRSKKNS